MHTVDIRNVTLCRAGTTVFDGLTLTLSERRIGLIGDNGTGKSSFFRLLCGLERADAGSVHIGGIDARELGARHPGRVGMMFQNPDEQIIFPTVDEELALGLSARGISRRQALEQARAYLQARGLSHWIDRAVGSLSQGQRQHVCWLALTIASPEILLLDEPFASLDLPGQARLSAEIARAPQQVLVSTHLLEHVRAFERVLWLDQGRVCADGPGTDVCAAYERDVAQRAASAATADSTAPA
jgi:biotin transport system ATP-binding protein